MNKKYEFHARAGDIPLIVTDMFVKKGSYGDAEFIWLLENDLLSMYWSEDGIKQASKIGEQMLDNDFFTKVINRMDETEEKIDKFSFALKEDKLIDEWKLFDNIFFAYSEVYRFCEEPFLRSIEKRLIDKHSTDILNNVLHGGITNIEFNDEEKGIINILKTVGKRKVSLHLKNEKIYADLAIFLNFLSKKIGILAKDLYYLKSDEIMNILKGGNVDINLINQRKKGCAFYGGPDSDLVCFTGEEFFKLKESIEPKTKEIKGFIANRGKVKGKVRVHLSWIKSIDFDEGDIIVTGMTNPQMFPYLKKAAAIVTDEGGVTCHAAIISRELGIPCIIGTKVASQILKDGDMVEVDALNGVVRKVDE